ncbi:MAG: Tfp pilus assembly protein FimT/FimU [Gemmatimonadales bacterium]
MNVARVQSAFHASRSGLRRAGFTLIEVLVAIAMVAVLAAIAIPRIDVDGYKVQSAVRAVTTTLTYSQRLAVTLQHDVWVAFDSTNSRLRIHEDVNNNGTIDPGERVTYTPLDTGVIFGRGAAPAYTIGAQAFNFTRTQNGMPAVIFRRDGSASENGGFYLNTKKAVGLGQTHRARAGEIIRSSGRITWYSYSSGAWVRGD